MDNKKKKPPAGATLIARMRANREKRDAQLAERQKKDPPPPAAERASKSSSKPRSTSVKPNKSDGAEFVSRPISIADLQPATYDYQQLTDEIRQAGRFAAAGLIAQGLRLYRLQSEDIYKDKFATFEEYCREEHDMSATYVYRLIRMAEMAEWLASESIPSSSADMPDPFEVMLGLGHRHLVAILPLEPKVISELLIKGLPTQTEAGNRGKRIPILKASEQQIRDAIKLLMPPAEAANKKTSKSPPVRSVHNLEELLDVMQEWYDWLHSQPDERLIENKIGDRTQANKLARRLHSLCEKLVEALHSLPNH